MQERLHILFDQYLRHSISGPELEEMAGLLQHADAEEMLTPPMEALWQQVKEQGITYPVDWDRMYAAITKKEPAKLRTLKRWAVAASITLLLGIGSYFLLSKRTSENKYPITSNQQPDINPGGYKAKLTLADGRIIVLDSATFGELAKQGNTSVINKDGRLVYESGVMSQESVIYNTVNTSNGETYSLTLADGSIVSLNSASSIRFPVAFTGAERRIEITGEAYFKVAKNTKQPFIVSVNGMEVQALGTEFNINAYTDEGAMSTTLIEGSVRVVSSEQGVVSPKQVIIKPGQQTLLKNNQLTVNNDVNIDEVIAWKENKFHFESADLKTILRQFARWYDIEVIYEGPVSSEKFFSIISRNTTLSNVLKSLQANDIKFRIEGKKLFVQSG